MLTSWKIRNNAEVHGVKFAATVAAKAGVNIDTVMFALFGKYSRKYSRG